MVLSISALIWDNIGTISIGLITFLVLKYLLDLWRLPPGPLPLPILGNLLTFRGNNGLATFKKLRRKYGDVYTVRLGSIPFVIISGYERTKEALIIKKNDFAGRLQLAITEMITAAGDDIAFVDLSPGWEVLKKLGLTAIRKYVGSRKMPEVLVSTVDPVIDDMLKEKGPVKIEEHIYLLIFSLAATASFGQSYQGTDKEFLQLKSVAADTREIIANGFVGDFVPLLRPFYRKIERKIKDALDMQTNLIMGKFMERAKTYKKGEIRDFSDALVAARHEAEEEDSKSLEHMTDNNLRSVVGDLFGAGVDTTSTTITWVILYLIKYPETQEKIYKEMQDHIGDRVAVQEDRAKMPYTWAVLTEILRLRMAAPFGLPHRTLVDTEVGGHKIPKGVGVLFHYDAMNKNPEAWDEPEKFKPERFLTEDGQFTKEYFPNYVPFGMGRRICVGEKLAKANIFLVTIRLLQRCKFVADGPVDIEPKDTVITYEPKPYTAFVQKRVA